MKILDEVTSDANRVFLAHVSKMFELMGDAVDRGQPDPEFFDLIGTNLEKSTIERLPQSTRDYARRLRHGAPVTPAQMNKSDALLVATHLFPKGSEQLDNTFGVGEMKGDETLQFVDPKSVVAFTQPSNPAELLEFLIKPTTKKVHLIRHPGQQLHTAIGGGEYVLAALITNVPLIPAMVQTPEDSLQGKDEPGRTVLQVGTEVQVGYNVPSYLEPWAEVARYIRDEKMFRLTQKREIPNSIKEKVALKRTLRRNLELEQDGIEQIVIDNALEQLEVSIAEDIKTLEQIFAVGRIADQKSQHYAFEDGISDRIPLEWGIAQLPVSDVSYRTNSVDVAMDVMVAFSENEWRTGKTEKLTPEGIVVIIDNGERLLESDPTRLKPKPKDEYKETMEAPITIPKFNVLIPVGTGAHQIETNLIPITAELNGKPLRVNKATWERNSQLLNDQVADLTKQCQSMSGWSEFRPNASADCIKVFVKDLGLSVQRITKGKGTPSMDKETLQVYEAQGNKLAGVVIQCREAISCQSQLNAWAEYAQAGQVQANWNQLGTPMGRYSCDNPNLQNRIVEIRETIEPDPGHVFLSLDLGQAEYVVWASLSKDPLLSSIFESGEDLHVRMANEIRTMVPNLNLHEQNDRAAGKTFNFAQLYLMQVFTLAKRLGIALEQAEAIMKAYAARAPIAIQYRDDYLAQAREEGRAVTRFGRIRLMPELSTARGPALHAAQKTAWHHHNSGTAAEVLKIKQVKAWKALRKELSEQDGRIVLQMHDEVIFSIKEDKVQSFREIAKEKFAERLSGFLPFRVDVRVGENWRSISK